MQPNYLISNQNQPLDFNSHKLLVYGMLLQALASLDMVMKYEFSNDDYDCLNFYHQKKKQLFFIELYKGPSNSVNLELKSHNGTPLLSVPVYNHFRDFPKISICITANLKA